jgi:hypothetical protein
MREERLRLDHRDLPPHRRESRGAPYSSDHKAGWRHQRDLYADPPEALVPRQNAGVAISS